MLLPLALLALSSCTGEAPGPDRALSPPMVRWSGAVPTVAWLSAEGADGALLHAEYGLTDLDTSTPPSEAGEVALLGLAAGHRYRARLVATWPDGHRAESEALSFHAPPAPEDLPQLEILHALPGTEMEGGYLVATVTARLDDPDGASFVAIYGGDGLPVWWWRLPEGHVAVSPSLSALPGALVFDDYDWSAQGLPGRAVRARLDGSSVESLPIPWGHHAVRELEPGTFAWLARDPRPAPGDLEAWITADAVLQGSLSAPGEARPVIAFYGPLYEGQYAPPCAHPLAPLWLMGERPLYEWSHANSLVWLPERDAFLVNLRWPDTLLLVDRASGAIAARLSGPLGEFTRSDGTPTWTSAADTLLSHGHLSDAWDGGLVAFDNGNHRDPPTSSVVELAWDEASRTLDEVFRWQHPDQLEVPILGDVRKLPSGSYLASWSTEGEITLITPTGTIAWRARTRGGEAVVRLLWLPSLYAEGVGR